MGSASADPDTRSLKINIRSETEADITAICEVTKTAFKDDPHGNQTEHLIVDALRTSGCLTVSLVAEIDDAVVGHVALSPVSISDGASDWYGLGPISVMPAYQGKGVGSALMNDALATLKAMDAAGCVLLGDPEYYRQFGFTVDSRLQFPGVPTEYFQALLFNGAMPEGDVTYHDSFYALG